MSIITVYNMTKDYGNGRGVYNLSFEVKEGEVFGFLGPNCSGKTTTIRQLVGFTKADSGYSKIFNLDCFRNREIIQKELGYLAGEISFIDDMNGNDFLKFVSKMKNIKDNKKINELLELYQLDANKKIKSMSKGMKQKIAIICAFMNSPKVVILDEPTSGLDPLMQKVFIEHILSEKEKGTTIFISSHIFEEIEKTCDRAAILKDGKLIAIENINELKNKKSKIFNIYFKSQNSADIFYNKIINEYNIKAEKYNSNIKVYITNDINILIRELSNYDIENIVSTEQSLEELFLDFYSKS